MLKKTTIIIIALVIVIIGLGLGLGLGFGLKSSSSSSSSSSNLSPDERAAIAIIRARSSKDKATCIAAANDLDYRTEVHINNYTQSSNNGLKDSWNKYKLINKELNCNEFGIDRSCPYQNTEQC